MSKEPDASDRDRSRCGWIPRSGHGGSRRILSITFFFGHSFFGELFDGFIGEMGIVVPRWRILTAYGELTTLCFWQLSRSSFRIEAVARGWAIR